MSSRIVSITLQQFCLADDQPRRILQEKGFEVRENKLGRRLKYEELTRFLEGADAAIAGVETFDAELLARLPKLKLISRCGVGTDSIDLAAARQKGVAILTTQDEVVEAVAEMTLAMIFALARNISCHSADFRSGQWVKRTGYLLSEWTIGLVGFGRIGRAVARLLRAFGPRILATDPALPGGRLPHQVLRRDLASLLAESDITSLHADVQSHQAPLLGRAEFAAMKPGARLVNTARGRLVDEDALLENLRSGHISAAALDVFAQEPYSGELARLPQVLCTPHVATLTRASRTAMELRSARNVVEFFSLEKRRR